MPGDAADAGASAPGEGLLTAREVARRAGIAPATLRRWVRLGLIPAADRGWTPAAAAHARIVARLRGRGHSVAEIRRATDSGRLAFAFVEDVVGVPGGDRTLAEATDEAGLDPELAERVRAALGFSTSGAERLSEDDVDVLRSAAAVLAAGFPLVAFLQLCRVYGQALAQIADAEVRLFHLYVHEPLMRQGIPGLEMAEEMRDLARALLPLASPMMDRVHRRHLQHFVEQDVIGHMEIDLAEAPGELGRLRVAIAFADLAGYTRLTEEEGEEEAVGAVERFVDAVEHTLPDDARVIKTIGDEVMVVGGDPAALVDWAVGFQVLFTDRPRPRIGLHHGDTLYRDGDYFGREVNLAARVAARAAGGEVVVTRPVVRAAGPHLAFEHIGEVRLKGFRDVTELFLARRSDP